MDWRYQQGTPSRFQLSFDQSAARSYGESGTSHRSSQSCSPLSYSSIHVLKSQLDSILFFLNYMTWRIQAKKVQKEKKIIQSPSLDDSIFHQLSLSLSLSIPTLIEPQLTSVGVHSSFIPSYRLKASATNAARDTAATTLGTDCAVAAPVKGANGLAPLGVGLGLGVKLGEATGVFHPAGTGILSWS